MASHAQAYRETSDLKSANSAPPIPSPLVRRIDDSRLPPRIRVTLKHFISESQHGPDLWASTFRASKAADVSYKTMQRHLDWLEREKILHKKHPANEFISGKGLRRPATYVLNGTSAKWLAARETYPQWQRRNRRQAPARKRPQRDPHPSHPAAPQPVPPQASAAEQAPPLSPIKAVENKFPARTRRDCKKVLERTEELLLPRVRDNNQDAGRVLDYLRELGQQLCEISPAISSAVDKMADQLERLGPVDKWPKSEKIESDLSALEKAMLGQLAKDTDEDLLSKISMEAVQRCRESLPLIPAERREVENRKFAEHLLLQHWKAPRLSLYYMPQGDRMATAPSRNIAFRQACALFHFSPESVIEGMKYWGFDSPLGEGEEGQGP
jgi:hypothetical protein